MCKHENVSITEQGTASTNHHRELDGRWSHNSDFGDYTGIVYVECSQCGLKRTYGKNRPKWLVKRLEEIEICS